MDELRLVRRSERAALIARLEYGEAVLREGEMPAQQWQHGLADAAAADHQYAAGEFGGFDSVIRHSGTLAKCCLACTFAAAARTAPRGGA